MQRGTEESERHKRETEKTSAAQQASRWEERQEHPGPLTHSTHCLCLYKSVSVWKHTGTHVCMRGVELGQLLLLELQLVRLSAEKGPEGMRRKEEEVWRKRDLDESMRRYLSLQRGFGNMEKKKKGAEMTGRGTESRTRRQLLRRAVWSCPIWSGNRL